MERPVIGAKHLVIAATMIAAAVIAPASASAQQVAHLGGAWKGGPSAAGDNTYIGTLDGPKKGAEVKSGASLAVSGWAVDVTAQGWAGFDQMTVYDNPIEQGGKKLVDGSVGLPRPDVASILGNGYWTNSGFSAVVPVSTLSQQAAGAMNVFVYLHTPSKGWWYKQTSVNVDAPLNLQYPSDPIVVITQPQAGDAVSQDQKSKNENKVKIMGWALDRNAITDPNTQNYGPANSGVCRVQLYLDGPRGQGTVITNSANLAQEIGPANSQPSGTPSQQGSGRSTLAYPSAQYGQQYNLAGWRWDVNPATLSTGPHSIYAYARGCVTGRETMAVQFFTISDIGHNRV